MMTSASRRRGSVPALLAGVAAVATDCGYLLIIRSEPTSPTPDVVPFIAIYMAAIAAAAVLGLALIVLEHRALAESVLIDAAVAAAALGFIAIFSIGLALLITAGLLGLAARSCAPTTSSLTRRIATLFGALAAIGLLIAGFTFAGVFWGN
jgi:hypothetical protein